MTTSPVTGPNETRFAPEATSPARARDFVERYLNERDLAYLVDASCLVVSELVTNAVVHARTTIRVSIEELPFCVKLTVYDESVDLPVLSLADRGGTDDENGRGLSIVDAFSEDWGIDLAGDEGKCIWALFAVRPKLSTTRLCAEHEHHPRRVEVRIVNGAPKVGLTVPARKFDPVHILGCSREEAVELFHGRPVTPGEAEAIAKRTYRWRRHLQNPKSYWITVAEAARILKLTPRQVKRLLDRGQLQHVRHASRVRLMRRAHIVALAETRY